MTKKKKPSAIAYSARAPIRHAYDSVLTRLARLAAFASSPLLIEWGEVSQRQEDLAVDDLIALAIHVRRILELTGQKSAASKVMVVAVARGVRGPIAVTRIVNGLIHHTQLRIVRHQADALPPPSRERPESWIEFMEACKVRVDPLVYLTSDQVDGMAFGLHAFAESVATEVLAPIVTYCSDNELYLEDLLGPD